MRATFLSITLALALIFAPLGSIAHSEPLTPGTTIINFTNWSGPALDTHIYVPETVTPSTAIVIVMHGWSRDIDRYFGDWQALGKEHGFIVVVPHFTVESFPDSNDYNLGHVFDEESHERRAEPSWTFSAIEALFDEVVTRLAGAQEKYTLYGHSAGGQFVHRYLYYKPEARVKLFIAANSGWYTMPEFDTKYPYGLGGSGLDTAALAVAFGKNMILLLGREDTDTASANLRQTSEAGRQGSNRFERGLTMYSTAGSMAEKLGSDLQWQLRIVDGAKHVNADMARVAATLVK